MKRGLADDKGTWENTMARTNTIHCVLEHYARDLSGGVQYNEYLGFSFSKCFFVLFLITF